MGLLGSSQLAAARTGRGQASPPNAGAADAPRRRPDQTQPPEGWDARCFGAIGNGVADDTAALQAFLDAVVSRGESGTIPAGTYRVTQPLRVGDSSRRTYRGFTIRGAGRAGPNGGRAYGGTLILMDAPGKAEAVILWEGNAWRDARLTQLGLASLRCDGADYGLLIRSSEVSQLEFDHLHVANVRTAFGLLRGTGENGEFCGWSHIQTHNVLNYFFSDAGQAYGLRFRDSFCYYRPGGTLFRFDTEVVGGGMRLINFDASPVEPDSARAPAGRADTTLLSLGGSHNAPVTMMGGRLEHISTLVLVDTGALNIIVHNQVQFIGVDFTTDLDEASAASGAATITLRNHALADLFFLGCSFAPAQPERDDQLIVIHADPACRATVRFTQCGHWGYAEEPRYAGPRGEAVRVSWTDCMINEVRQGRGFAARAMGGRYDRRINDPANYLANLYRATLSFWC